MAWRVLAASWESMPPSGSESCVSIRVSPVSEESCPSATFVSTSPPVCLGVVNNLSLPLFSAVSLKIHKSLRKRWGIKGRREKPRGFVELNSSTSKTPSDC